MKTTLILALAGAFLFTGCAAKTNVLAPIAYQQEVDEVEKLLNRGNMLQAVDELSVLIQINPKASRAIFLRGVAYQGLERFDRAVEDFQSVLKLEPKSEKSHYNLGMIYAYKLNEPKLALKHFDQFLTLSPQHAKAFSVAKTMASLDGPDRLLMSPGTKVERVLDEVRNTTSIGAKRSLLENAIKEYPNSPIFPYLLGRTYDSQDKQASDDWAKAKSCYEKTLAIRPTCAPCQKALGALLVRQGQLQEGQLHLRKASLFDPS